MTTSLLIIPPDISTAALSVSSSAKFDRDHPLSNLLTGGRRVARLASSGSSVSITFDLGTGKSRTIDHLGLGNCKALLSGGVTQAIAAGSDDGSTWTNLLGTASGFSTRAFDGPESSDLIFTPSYNDQIAATISAHRYFRVTLAGGTHKFPFSKLYLGSAFDMGKEPDDYDMAVETDQDSDTWRYDRGQVLMTKAYHPRRKFTLEWDGVADAKAREFEERILWNPYTDSVFLHAAQWTDPLYGLKLVHCEVVGEECSVSRKQRDWADVKAVFRELV